MAENEVGGVRELINREGNSERLYTAGEVLDIVLNYGKAVDEARR